MGLKLPNSTKEFLREVRMGNVPGYSLRDKFGRNAAIGMTPSPITMSGFYRTPTAPVSLEVISTSAGDTAAGAGAQSVKLNCIVADWSRETITVAMNGATAVPLGTDVLRVDSFEVATSGAYAEVATPTPSQLGEITLQVVGGGDVWAKLALVDTAFGAARSQIGCVSIEDGKTGFLIYKNTSVESTQTVTLYRMVRERADTIADPFSPMTLRTQLDGIIGVSEIAQPSPGDAIVGPADIFNLAGVSAAAASVSIDFTLLLVDTDLVS